MNKLKRRAEDEPEKESLVLINDVPVKKEKIERYQVRAQKRGLNIADGPLPDDRRFGARPFPGFFFLD